MIHNIRVFNPKGELIKVINGQKMMDAKYREIAGSISKTVWGKSAKKHKTKVKCTTCKKEVLGRINQTTCGSPKCIRIRAQLKNHPKSFRTFKCAECKKEIKTYHHNKKTCGAEECFKANRAKGESTRMEKLKEKLYAQKRSNKRRSKNAKKR
jgi:hypothetical protein